MTDASNEAPRQQKVRCQKCGAVWAAFTLPAPMAELAASMIKMRCEACGAGPSSLSLFGGSGGGAASPDAQKWPGLTLWLASGERGTSSETIVQTLTGIPALGRDTDRGSPPLDPADLRRCRLLLEAVPSLVPLLPKMAAASKDWAGLIAHWAEICALMDEEVPDWRDPRCRGMARKTYERMKSLRV